MSAELEIEYLKRCKVCKLEKVTSEFSRVLSPNMKLQYKGGFYPICKACTKKRKADAFNRKRNAQINAFFDAFKGTITPPDSPHAYLLFTLIHKAAWPKYLDEFNERQGFNGIEPWLLEDIEHQIANMRYRAKANQDEPLPPSRFSEVEENGISPSRQKRLLIPLRQCSTCNKFKQTYWFADDEDVVNAVMIGRRPYNGFLHGHYFEKSGVSECGWKNICRNCQGESPELIERIGTTSTFFQLIRQIYKARETPIPLPLLEKFPKLEDYFFDLPFQQYEAELKAEATEANKTLQEYMARALPAYTPAAPVTSFRFKRKS